jgi:hypothetical protein
MENRRRDAEYARGSPDGSEGLVYVPFEKRYVPTTVAQRAKADLTIARPE